MNPGLSGGLTNVISGDHWPLAGSKNPAEDDPERQHDDDEDGARTDRHQRLEDEPSVEVNAVQRADTSRRRVGE